MRFEPLQNRYAFAGIQNFDLPCDVDGSGLVSSVDALVVIDTINRSSQSNHQPALAQSGRLFLDVDGDGQITPLDPLLVIDALNRNQRPLTLAASVDPSDDPNFNGVVLAPEITIQGQTSPFAQVRFKRVTSSVPPSEPFLQVSSNGNGMFSLIIPLSSGENAFVIEVRDELGRRTNLTKSWYHGDIVADWNATMLNAVRDWTGLSNDPYPNRIVPSRPPIVTRNLAMVHSAMFDAGNAVESRFSPYLDNLPQDSSASTIAAMATAAHGIAIQLYSDRDETPVFDATLAASLALVPDGEAKTRGIAMGREVSRRMLAARATDGSTTPSNYIPSGQVGKWNRTEPDFTPPELPQWKNVKLFGLPSLSALSVSTPPSLESSEYASAVDEVMRLGRIDSSERTADQTAIAKFWADGAGTATPPGHWNRIATDILMAQNGSLLENARTLALLNISLADAAIAAWDVKYSFELWRPIHAIRRADQDGNDLTIQDASWAPYLKTPAHPSYVSGHSTFSAAAATVLTHVFGDSISFTSSTDPLSGLTQRPLAPELISTRTYASFWQAAEEAGSSRIYGGIHFSFDNTAGLELGKAVGELIVGSWLKPV
jgi:membrane-associated phospholipid phosphatase